MANTILQDIKERIRRWRGFLFAMLAVFLVWVFSAMAETKSYTEIYALHIEGIDTARYAVSQTDTTITLELQSNGFNALYRSLEPRRTLHINVAAQIRRPITQPTTLNINLYESIAMLTPQLRMTGVREVKPTGNSLKLNVAPRESRTMVADLRQVKFAFDGSYGLCGDIKVEPDSVVLYGSRKSLNQVGSIMAEATTFDNICQSNTYRVALQPDWKQYPDLRCSTDSISIYVPVAAFVEKKITLPVTVTGNIEGQRIHLHPATVTLHCLVAEQDYSQLSASDFHVTAAYRGDNSDYLQVIVSQFPANVRIMNTTPSRLQYTVIQ